MGSWVFWGGAGIMLLGVVVILSRALRVPVAAPVSDVHIYKDQLADVDRDVARGVLTESEAGRLRVEVSRRILAADRMVTAAPMAGHLGLLAVVIAVVLGASVWGYLQLGAVGYADLPLAGRIAMAEDVRANRPSQTMAEAQVTLPSPTVPDADDAALMEKLRRAVADRPNDVQGLALLARNEAGLGNLAAARVAQQALIAAKGAAVTADDHADLAELLVAQAGGYVSPEAETVLEDALKRDAANPKARYYAGLMLAQVGRYDLAFRLWKPLVGLDGTWDPALRRQIADVALRAGVAFTLPEPLDFTPEQMVAQLSDRLATQGGPATDWARLITSLTVLGRTDQAKAIYDEARTTFAANAPDLAVIDAAAAEAGL